ncbi:MAG: sugar porter family MFS transporter [Candidatus Nanopelagicales bacterium]
MSAASPSADTQRIPRTAIMVAVTAATLGIIYGYDQSNIGGAQLYFQQDLGLDTTAVESVVAAIVIGEIVGALIGGWVANRIGRKLSMIVVASGYIVFCLLSAFAWDITSLWVARVLLGLTIGISLVAVPVFVAESVPARIRGATLVAYQVSTVIGIIIGYLVAALLSDVNDQYNWRLMLGIAAVPAVILLPFLVRLPETARWYMLRNRREEARKSLTVTDPDADIEHELDEMAAAISDESGGAIGEMLRKPYLRATVFVLGLGFFIQITGINATVTYGPKIFGALGIESDQQKLLLNVGIQFIALIAVLISMRTVDRWGRRPILLTGIAIMIGAQILMVITFATVQGDTYESWQKVLGFLGIAFINIGFVFGFGALVWVYSSEAFPARLRAYGSSAMLTADLVANWIIANFFLSAMERVGGAVSFGFFAIMAVLAWIFVFKLAPETKGRELEEIRHYWENGGKWVKTPVESA